MPQQKNSVNFDVPISLSFLAYVVNEREKFNRIRVLSVQYRNHMKKRCENLPQKEKTVLTDSWTSLFEEMKVVCGKYSKIMSYVARQLGAKINWGMNGGVVAVTLDNYRYSMEEIQDLAQNHIIDEILFPELKVAMPAKIDDYIKRYEALKATQKSMKKAAKKGRSGK